MTQKHQTRYFTGPNRENYRATYDPDSFLPKGWGIYRNGSAVNWRKTEAEMFEYFRQLGAKEGTTRG